MDLNFLIWSFLIVFMLHNFEEILMIERWFHKTYPVVQQDLPLWIKGELEQHKSMTGVQFSMVVTILSVGTAALILLTVSTDLYFFFLGINTFFALNIFTHPVQALLLRHYVPGLWTTILLIIPYEIIVFYQVYQQGILDITTVIYSIIVMIVIIPVFIMSHKFAEKWYQGIST